MNIELETRPLAEVECDAIVVVAFEQETPQGAAAEQAKELYDSGEFSGKALEIAVLHRPRRLESKAAGAGRRRQTRAVRFGWAAQAGRRGVARDEGQGRSQHCSGSG